MDGRHVLVGSAGVELQGVGSAEAEEEDAAEGEEGEREPDGRRESSFRWVGKSAEAGTGQFQASHEL